MSRKRINPGEEWYSRETDEEKRACTSNAESFMVIMEADDSVGRPRCVVAGTSSSEAPNQDLEEKKILYEIKEKFRLYARRCWDDYWKMVLQIILNGKTPTVSFNEMYKDLYRSICQLETEPPKTTYAKDPTQISLRSWFLLNPFLPEHTEEDVVICHFWLHTKGTLSIMEQRNDAGVNAESVLSKRLRMLKEQGKCHIVGVMELICSWSFCKRCIKRVADEIKRVHPGVTKIIFRIRSVTSVTSLFGVEVHPFKSDCWKEMRKYLTDEGSSYIGNDDPSVSQIADFLNTRASNTFSSVVHGRVMPLKTWFLFNEQLRTCNVRYITCIVCCVTFSSSTAPFCLHQTNETRDVHAEAVTLMRLEAMQAEAKDRNDSIRCIRIYSTYSPCPSCISRYCIFLEGMPELEELHLIFSCIYLSNEPQVNAELQAFEKKFRQKVKVEAFNDEYWEALKEHLSEEGAKDLENKSKNFEVSRPLFSNWGQSPATTPKKVKN